MNKFQRERAEFFKTYRFSEERQQHVMERVQKKKARLIWGWLGVSCAVVLFLVLAISLIKERAPSMTATYTEESAFAAFAAIYEAPEEEMQLLDIKLPYVTDNDALIIARDTNAEYDLVRVQRLQFVDEKWLFFSASNVFDIGEQEYPVYWDYVADDTVQLVAGIVEDTTIDAVYVGRERAKFYELGGGTRFWIADALTAGSPVFYERGDKRERKPSYDITWGDLTIPYVEAIGNEYTASFSSNTMEKGNGEYTKYPVVIDPYYYGANRYADGDVVAINVDGKEQLTRIITEQNTNISIEEGTVVINNHAFDTTYTWAHFNGDNTIYTGEQSDYGTIQPDEVFVMPDNWASDGVRGRVKKEAIIGKVIGYSKMDLPAPWTAEEKARYKKFAMAHDNKVLKNASPQQVLRMQRYAQYVGDYKTMYALYSKASKRKTYEDWLKTASLVETKQHIIYEATIIGDMELNEENNQLQTPSKRPFTFKMEQEDGVWKVVYDTVRVIYQ